MSHHTMQAALALSPTNKARTTLADGSVFLVQEYAYERYRMWIVAAGDVPVWGGPLTEQEIDTLSTRYQVDPAARIWEPLGIPTADFPAIAHILQELRAALKALRAKDTEA